MINLNDSTPVAPANAVNVTWQKSGTDVSAHVSEFAGDGGSGGASGLVPAPVAGDAAAGKFLKADGTWEAPPVPPRSCGATFDGGGAALSSGAVAYLVVPKGGTIVAWNILVDAGTCTIKVWKVARGTAIPTGAASITTAGLAITSGTALHNTTLTDFTTLDVADGDLVAIYLHAVTAATKIFFSLEII